MSKPASRIKSETNWENLATMQDSDLILSDIPELDASFFKNAELRLPKPKKAISLRIDDDVINWFRHQGKGYQTRINAALRLYIQARSLPSQGARSHKNRLKLRRTADRMPTSR
jgi:uncharacterized protein (DUF4415 family)